jgi:hypothetical protein
VGRLVASARHEYPHRPDGQEVAAVDGRQAGIFVRRPLWTYLLAELLAGVAFRALNPDDK